MPVVTCPNCRTAVEVEVAHLGAEVQCGQCDGVFTATATPPGRARGRRDEDDDDFDNRSRRRRRPTGYDPDEGSYDEALRIVRPAANGLIWTGWGGVFLHLFGGIAMAIGGYVLQQNIQPGPLADKEKADAAALMVVGVLFALFGPIYCVFLAIGGHRLKALKGTGMPMTAAIMGIATIALCGICNPVTWSGMAFGIMTIVALNKPVVKWALARNSAGVDDRD
jgi:predicted Zn finger-like uncharacterized protein